MRSYLILLFCLCPLLVFGQLTSGVVDSTRAINWTSAGANIPTRNTVCASLTSSATASQISTAIQSCTSGQVVSLAAGTYNLAGCIDWGHVSNVTLRGAGPDLTRINFSTGCGCAGFGGADVCIITANDGDGTDNDYNNQASWTGGYSVGTTSITVNSFSKGSVGNISVGSLIFLDQTDDTSDTGQVYICQISGTCSGENGSGNGRRFVPATQEEPQIVTSVSGSGPWTIGITPGVRMPNIVSGKSPTLWSNNGLPIQGDGVEALTIDATGSGEFTTIFILDGYNDWIKNVRFIEPGTSGSGSYAVYFYQTIHSTLRDTYSFGGTGSSNNYILSNWTAADNLFENNITQSVTFSNMQEGCIGCVQGYNFAVNDYYTGGGADPAWQQASSYHHGSGDAYVLFEGNEGIGMTADDVHGTSNFFTAFRNYWNGRDTAGGSSGGKTEQSSAIIMNAYNRYYNLIGNVLGTSGFHTNYQVFPTTSTTAGNSTTSNVSIYGNLGFSGNGGTYNGVFPNDTFLKTSLMRWGNFDTVTNAVRWCGNSSDTGWSGVCSSTSEVPTGISPYSNAVPTLGDTTAGQSSMPSSFYYSSKPSWWPSSKAWPPIGPEISGGNLGICSSGTYAGSGCTSSSQCSGGGTCSSVAGGRVYSIPAMDCYLTTMGGKPDGSGSVLTFNANTCYYTPVTAVGTTATGGVRFSKGAKFQ